MRKTVTGALAALVLVLVAPGPQAAAPEHGPPAETAEGQPVGPQLPPQLRALLIQEMNAVLAASKAILDALVRGQDGVVAEQARGIHESFILKQTMTAEDRETLHEAAPHGFLERDRAFHALAAGLATAAQQGDQPKQRALFAEMLDACTGCHARYATDRFPGLKLETEPGLR